MNFVVVVVLQWLVVAVIVVMVGVLALVVDYGNWFITSPAAYIIWFGSLYVSTIFHFRASYETAGTGIVAFVIQKVGNP